MGKFNVLVGSLFGSRGLDELGKNADLYYLKDMDEKRLDELLPEIDCFFADSWPKELSSARVAKMSRLRFIQSESAGVNTWPLKDIGNDITVCSNAGGYSVGVAEYAMALLMVAAKRIMTLDSAVREDRLAGINRRQIGNEMVILEGKKLGVLGYGGIGRAVGKMARGMGMEVYAYSRGGIEEKGIRRFEGEEGLMHVLRESDAVVIALPLTSLTRKIIDKNRLSVMKSNCIVVNVGRGDIVNERDMYDHLRDNRNFFYATDVWWFRDGRESFVPESKILELDNFIGVPHISGVSAHSTGEPTELAVRNILRFIRGEKVSNVVNRSDYA